MKRFSFLLLFSSFCLIATAQSSLTGKVNPIIGTNGMGHTFPGACVPYGFVQLSPDTDTIPHNVEGKYQPRAYEYCAGYQHKDSTIVGFSHTHFSGTGHSDLGDILVMPVTGSLKLNPGTATDPESGYRSRFSHDTEISRPGYYEVLLADYGIKAQLTATQRVGVHKYTFPSGSPDQRIILDMIHGIYNYDGKVLWTNIRVENDTLITGYRITNGWARTNYTYFAMSFSKPVIRYGCEEKAKVNYRGGYGKFNMKENFPDIGGRKIVAYFDFDPAASRTLEIKVALSGVSTDGALKNLKQEAAGKTFDQVAASADAGWNRALSVIEAQGTDDQLAMLYTSLYHTMINPCVYTDVDGRYRGIDSNIHQADDFVNYTVFSVWDTYRALHPLFNIINRQVNTDIARSMLKHCEQSVHKALPVWSHMANENWCMIGYHSVSVLADAIAKGLPVDKEKALKAMVSSSTIPYYDGTKEYMQLGYVPLDRNGSAASLTLEYAYDDWAIYATALAKGDKQVAETYKQRARNYQNMFKPELGYACPRYSDGRWKNNLNLLSTHGEGFIEGNALNYSFYVPQDVNGMINLMGGDQVFIAKLDSLFTMELPEEFFAETEDVTKEGLLGGYVHGNEPSHHIPFLYAWTEQPWKTQYWQREIMNRMYRNNIDGLCGNDDCGQMSAWYILSAMGFYPVCPGTDQYVLGAPYLPYMKVNLENGNTFVIEAPKVSDKNRYVKSVVWNGKPYTKGYITQADIMNGGTLKFEMASRPNKNRLFKGEDQPYSLTE
ncbi:GH92 family glycosyl hydrolase [Parabacteroides pacaensis]|uniref:GH92 family glycosyl hydrolase n=1 Tax=Parabacteroides pacaensis TaxID=2086575 RepID=UPI000D104ACC|nr:GH92 family glycosyl hydrolase [Parabacteroides pacaensis]